MLNSNYFSKRAFAQNLQVFNLWLEQQYNISCSKEEDVFTKQVHFYHSYIKYINYREKYIQDRKKKAQNKLKEENKLLISIKNQLLINLDIKTYSEHINK